MKLQRDYIIVGQGIAGTVLSHALIKRGFSVMLIDDPSLSKASKVAAGLYNPIVFKRLVKSWMADELIPVMDEFYTSVEKLLNEQFYFKKQIVKLFTDQNERDFWIKKTSEDVGKYLSKTISNNFLKNIVNDPSGAAEVLHAGNLDTVVFLETSRKYFRATGSLLEGQIRYEELEILSDHVNYKNISAGRIIFCEGFKSVENPWFHWLPFRLTKGEVLIIRLKDNDSIPIEKVINKGVFILPLGNNIYKVGSTYEWDDLHENITEKGRSELISKLEKVLKVEFEIIDQQAGIRPTVVDRRPILGLHPNHSSLVIFNGMGTKGVMLAPYFASQLIDFLELKMVLDPEVSIGRFEDSFFRKKD